jgi:hypothetical protein
VPLRALTLLPKQCRLFAADAAALNYVQSTLARASRPSVLQSRGCHYEWLWTLVMLRVTPQLLASAQPRPSPSRPTQWTSPRCLVRGTSRTHRDAHLGNRWACRVCICPWPQESAVPIPSLDWPLDRRNFRSRGAITACQPHVPASVILARPNPIQQTAYLPRSRPPDCTFCARPRSAGWNWIGHSH